VVYSGRGKFLKGKRGEKMLNVLGLGSTLVLASILTVRFSKVLLYPLFRYVLKSPVQYNRNQPNEREAE
jgi:hypothetical protein